MDDHTGFRPRILDDDPDLLEQSFRLRYQVYCVERAFLEASAYPDQRETDEFDDHSLHVGAVDASGSLAGTARVIKANRHGFPMFRHCAFFPEVQMLDAPQVLPVEISRVAISRHCTRQSGARRRSEPFLTLMKAVLQAAKLAGATHLIGATDAALHRWLVHYGLPYRVSGPTVDYYGPVAACIMSLREYDEVVVGGRFPALDGFPVGWDPSMWPGFSHTGLISC
jgi:N-acyl amino acid synthase of PEP-CTERM/exosortase system